MSFQKPSALKQSSVALSTLNRILASNVQVNTAAKQISISEAHELIGRYFVSDEKGECLANTIKEAIHKNVYRSVVSNDNVEEQRNEFYCNVVALMKSELFEDGKKDTVDLHVFNTFLKNKVNVGYGVNAAKNNKINHEQKLETRKTTAEVCLSHRASEQVLDIEMIAGMTDEHAKLERTKAKEDFIKEIHRIKARIKVKKPGIGLVLEDLYDHGMKHKASAAKRGRSLGGVNSISKRFTDLVRLETQNKARFKALKTPIKG